jgi:hypothetical protein
VPADVAPDSTSGRFAELRRGNRAGERQVEGAGEDRVDVGFVRRAARGRAAGQLRDEVVDQLAEPELGGERGLEAADLPEVVAVSALPVGREAGEVGVEQAFRRGGVHDRRSSPPRGQSVWGVDRVDMMTMSGVKGAPPGTDRSEYQPTGG